MKVSTEGRYSFTWKEHIYYLGLLILVSGVVGWTFYDWPGFSGVALLFYYPFYKICYKYKINKLNKQLQLDFKDTMLSIYSSLSAGSALEESVRRSLQDVQRHWQTDNRMIYELMLICQKMDRNVPVNQCLEEMAFRCENSDMADFAQIMAIGKRQGGNIARFVRDSVEKIQQRIEMTYEIEGIIGAKRNEFFIMCIIPIGIIIYMRLFSREFMAVLYADVIGRICMTICLFVYILAVFWGVHILKLN